MFIYIENQCIKVLFGGFSLKILKEALHLRFAQYSYCHCIVIIVNITKMTNVYRHFIVIIVDMTKMTNESTVVIVTLVVKTNKFK